MSPLSRNPAAAHLCRERDNNRCIFTQYENPEAAHIFPFAAIKNPQTFKHLVALLRMFWGDDAADTLLKLAQSWNITESPQNLLSLNHQLHSWFDSARMALKPLRKLDDGSVVVQVHWLRTSARKPKDNVHQQNVARILATANLSGDHWGSIVAHRASGLLLKTGQVFTSTANNPSHVPNFDLLQLSWDLLRMISICGAAKEDVDDNDDVVDDDGFGVEANEGMYEEDDGAQIYQWAMDVETVEALEEEESEGEGREEEEEEETVDGSKSPH